MTEKQGSSIYDHNMRVWEADRQARTQAFTTHMQALVSLASLVFNSIILGNGAAAAAVLAFLGAMWGKPEAEAMLGPVIHSLMAFAGGMLAAMLATATGYVSQYFEASADLWVEHPWGKAALRLVAAVLLLFTVALVCGAMYGFYFGVSEGIHALSLTKGGVVKDDLAT
jgi:hypothetical protein